MCGRSSSFVFVAVLATVLAMVSPTVARAAPVLTVETITWDVIGLDSNNPLDGPDLYPVAVEVCNTGDMTASNSVATFVWDSANGLVNLESTDTQSIGDLASGSCVDVYYNVVVTRDLSVIDTTRAYHIEVTADGLGVTSTPTPRQLYVEGVIDQNRNSVVGGIAGPTLVTVGDQYTYTVNATTAPNGYEQISSFIDFPSDMFRVVSVVTTYSTPAGASVDSVYADACGWDLDPTSGSYRTCVGPENYVGGKAGDDLTITYVVEIISAGSATVSAAITDVSGASYHYNADYGTAPNLLLITAIEPPLLAATKVDALSNDADASGNVTAGDTLTYTTTITNSGLGDATGVSFTDTPDASTTLVVGSVATSQGSITVGNTVGDVTVAVDVGTVAAGASAIVSFDVLVNDPIVVASVSNQGLITSTELPDVMTDDPDDPTSGADPTTTPIGDQPPVAIDDAATTNEDTPVVITVLTNDSEPEGEAISVTAITNQPANGSVVMNADGSITYTPNADFVGTDTFVYEICDTDGLCDTATVTVTVVAVNDPPVAEDDAEQTGQNTAVDIPVLVNDSDPDGDVITVTSIVSAPENGTAVINPDGSITYTPVDDFSGSDTFVYQICDPSGLCDSATVTVVVGLPATGFDDAAMAVLAVGLIGLGALFVRLSYSFVQLSDFSARGVS